MTCKLFALVAGCGLAIAAAGDWKAMYGGKGATCAIDSANRVWCAGAATESGSPSDTNVLQPISLEMTFTALSVGGGHVVGILTNGTIMAWGRGSRGQLGNGRAQDSVVPVVVATPPGVRFTAVEAGSMHTLALAENGTAFSWGAGDSGQLGNGQVGDVLTPGLVLGGGNYTQLAAGGYHSCFIDIGGLLSCTGQDIFGQLGLAGSTADQVTPQSVKINIFFVGCGFQHTCAVTSALNTYPGSVYCWGKNDVGQVGTGVTGSPVDTPFPLPAFPGSPTAYSSVHLGYAHTLAVADQPWPNTWTFGSNANGQCGTGKSNPFYSDPIELTVSSPFSTLQWSQVDAGWNHNVGVNTDAATTAASWGQNTYGQLCDGTNADVDALTSTAQVADASATPTATATGTSTSSFTATATMTSSATATGSSSSTASSTSTSTASLTPTSTASGTSNATLTATATATATSTGTSASTATSTSAPTSTSTASVSRSASVTPSVTPSLPAAFAPFVGLPVIPQYGSWLGVFAAAALVVVVGGQIACRSRTQYAPEAGHTRFMRLMGTAYTGGAPSEYTPLSGQADATRNVPSNTSLVPYDDDAIGGRVNSNII